MSRLMDFEEQYKWVEHALLEEFPTGVVGVHWSDYGNELQIGIYLTLPNGVSWRKGLYCVKDGKDLLSAGNMDAETIKAAFRRTYQRACDEQQESGA
jgi:hypothetical protein